jgi:hypothetical protein
MRQGNSENDDQIEEKGKMGDDSVPNNSPKPSLTGRISNVQGRQTLQECPVKRERMTPFIMGHRTHGQSFEQLLYCVRRLSPAAART